MNTVLQSLFDAWSTPWLFAVMGVAVAALTKGGDLLIDEAVALSRRWGLPKVVIGATVVSIGTTLPEAAVSVLAALQGQPGLAMGNAVGSIICNTGLILGVSICLTSIPVIRRVVRMQGGFLLVVLLLLVMAALPWRHPAGVFTTGGGIPRAIGFVFLALLAVYILVSVRSLREQFSGTVEVETDPVRSGPWSATWRLSLGLVLIVAGSQVLIAATREVAVRLHVPESVVAATLVAFGTSLPELVTALTAVRKGHGELALGNVIGANILNVLFVVGASAAVTTGGLQVPPRFFVLLFPAMFLLQVVLMLEVVMGRGRLRRPAGMVLLGAYGVFLLLSYGG